MSNQTTSLNSSDDMKEESTFNVEDLVKKIDAKIAELEEEERKEQQEKKQNNNMVDPNLNDLINNNEPIRIDKDVPIANNDTAAPSHFNVLRSKRAPYNGYIE